MPKAYWITTYHSISDISKVEAYAKLAGPAVEACGGQYLARGVAQAVYEAGIAERTVLSVFPSLDAAIKAHDSQGCLLYTSPSPRDGLLSRMPSSA